VGHYRLQGLGKGGLGNHFGDLNQRKLYFNNLPAVRDYRCSSNRPTKDRFSQTVFSKPFTIQKPFTSILVYFLTCVFLSAYRLFFDHELFEAAQKIRIV